ncbi:hypothetical protein SASPL_150446 [Salvia splendens]|uniref:Nodulin homeobox N-terminal domain-containing protein n=1 Tax=Salvia splendens TaxID=180675 RepID=A0A8X8Z2P2_SALSN|nr:hypothetical protein SASPL_150446 [Salvia splendens]
MNLKLSCSDNISSYMAVISCLKSKALSILMQLCEAESVSYPDDVASNTATQDMAKSAGDSRYWFLKSKHHVLALLKKAWYRFKTVKCSLRGKLPNGQWSLRQSSWQMPSQMIQIISHSS